MFLFFLQTFALLNILNKLDHVGGLDVGRHSARILQGIEVNINDFPYYAGLLNCGATILSENWVVTAAHCVYPEPIYRNFVWVGGESFSTSKLVTFDRVFIHDRPSYMPIVNDIALLHLSKPLKFTDKIRPADLPIFKDLTRSNEDTQLVLAGRGLDETGYVSKTLKKMNVDRLSTEECLSYIPKHTQEQIKPIISLLEKAIICTKRTEGGPGMCQGDSGSPLMQGNTLVGIASFNGASCEVANLGFYVNVVNYVPWIKSITGL